jgi:hypothetical protein
MNYLVILEDGRFAADPKARKFATEYPDAHKFDSATDAYHVAKMLNLKPTLVSKAHAVSTKSYEENDLPFDMPRQVSAAHSPAPWSRGCDATGAKGMDGQGYAICSGPHVIARVVGMGYPIGKGSHPESDANAKLIAAAPDTADALRDLLKAFRECIGSAAFWDFEQNNPAVRAAMRAIAKAGL